ncbi:MAG: hypothetical protein JNL21_29800 [Myxococcales bacterium]|nr:hypothetical protein [Myxococcales bacterium]
MHKAWILSFVGAGLVAAGALGACGDSEGSGGSGSDDPTSNSTTTGTGSTTGTMQTTTTGGMTTSSSTSSGSTSSGPIECSDMVTTITGECDLLQQDCGPGETCLVAQDPNDPANSVSACAPAGLVGLGQPCEPGDCQEGMLCVGTCTYVCCPEGATMGANEPCGLGQCSLNVSFKGTDDSVYVCTYDEVCNFFDPNTCPTGKDCHFAGNGLANCSVPSPGDYMDGEMCEGFANDCPDSAICIDADGPMMGDDTLYCRYFCDPNLSGQPAGLGGCPAGQTCDTSVYDFGFPADLGFCHP